MLPVPTVTRLSPVTMPRGAGPCLFILHYSNGQDPSVIDDMNPTCSPQSKAEPQETGAIARLRRLRRNLRRLRPRTRRRTHRRC